VGDRFAHEGINQLKALIEAEERFGVHFVPVWNKSNREHQIVGTEPIETRREADAAVKALNYKGQYFVDADHINLTNVDRFIDSSDFFTIDVADYIGKTGSVEERFLPAIKEAGRIYRHIAEKKGAGNFVTEVSMDEVDEAQTPEELRYILREIAKEGIPVQTIAPKFTGRFNKGVDYRGDLARFEREFEQDLLVIEEAVREYGLPENLKLSIHSGSDKFSIYPIMGRLIRKYDKGIHIKTAGTTWLEENIGLAVADPDALALAKKIYVQALGRMDELTVPYATVIDVDVTKLPTPEEVAKWDAQTYARTMRHNQEDPLYNPSFRQLIHVSYKIAAELADEFLPALEKHTDVIGEQITANLCDRHIARLFSK
jgi:SAM-dependent methyltransferase